MDEKDEKVDFATTLGTGDAECCEDPDRCNLRLTPGHCKHSGTPPGTYEAVSDDGMEFLTPATPLVLVDNRSRCDCPEGHPTSDGKRTLPQCQGLEGAAQRGEVCRFQQRQFIGGRIAMQPSPGCATAVVPLLASPGGGDFIIE